MTKITVEKCPIEGLYVITPKVFGDERGYFTEIYNKDEMRVHGLDAEFVQDNQSMSKKGVLRGLHFQKTHPQGKLVRVIEGEVFDVAVDMRADSPTLGKWFGVVLSGENMKQFYIEPGFAHGFFVMSDTAVFQYKCTDMYCPDDEGGVMWNDPDIAVEWPLKGTEPRLSEKDTRQPAFKDAYRF